MADRSRAGLVALGYADERIDPAHDTDPLASRLGGRPLWLDGASPPPARDTAVCGQCGSDMLLLVQAYVPLHGSPYDRVLYVWACNRRACSGRPGATRAVRAHLLNAEYAKRLEKSKTAKSKARAAPAKPTLFSGGGQGPAPPLDFGSVWRAAAPAAQPAGGLFSGPLFGKRDSVPPADELSADIGRLSIAPSPAEPSPVEPSPVEPSRPEPSQPDTTEDWVDWSLDVQGAQAMYLAFEDEDVAGTKDRGRGRAGPAGPEQPADDGEWGEEKYEAATLPRGTDAAFARFARTASRNPEQVMRYQFGGAPLLYTARDETARLLGAAAPGHEQHADDSDSDGDDGHGAWGYSPGGLPRCPRCGGRRVFECQLMPALLSVLRLSSHVPQRQMQQQRLVGRELMQAVDLGAEFGTVLVFVCEDDCHDDGQPAAAAAYYDELVLVQLEAHAD
ncbi:hypothetical protein H4R18_004975 [Coemansia javaensis]|uniref:Programmed cell death protein 2 C-terminal domain-containing protein n=1 Tax=Coemansia javaensis TaxID=2761396 RepID=A0A9W8H979_9FUNG|nr:hypothetical protein H4R18_004975 [Coemansia javaensis]